MINNFNDFNLNFKIIALNNIIQSILNTIKLLTNPCKGKVLDNSENIKDLFNLLICNFSENIGEILKNIGLLKEELSSFFKKL
jgi:hypothetical protein